MKLLSNRNRVHLTEYLQWARAQKGLDAVSRKKIDEALGKLKDKHWG